MSSPISAATAASMAVIDYRVCWESLQHVSRVRQEMKTKEDFLEGEHFLPIPSVPHNWAEAKMQKIPQCSEGSA